MSSIQRTARTNEDRVQVFRNWKAMVRANPERWRIRFFKFGSKVTFALEQFERAFEFVSLSLVCDEVHESRVRMYGSCETWILKEYLPLWESTLEGNNEGK